MTLACDVVSTDPKKIEAATTWPQLHTATALRRFLDSVGTTGTLWGIIPRLLIRSNQLLSSYPPAGKESKGKQENTYLNPFW